MKTKKDQLIDRVLKEMENDIATGDFTAIEELLTFVPTKYLKGYLPEETESIQLEKDVKNGLYGETI